MAGILRGLEGKEGTARHDTAARAGIKQGCKLSLYR
jgi:hypothetical protein